MSSLTVTPLSCFPLSRCNFLAFRTPVLLRLLLDLDKFVCIDPLGMLPLFLKIVADIFFASKLSIINFSVGSSDKDRFWSVCGPLI